MSIASRKGRLRHDNAHRNAARYGTEAAEPRDRKSTVFPADIARTRALSGPVKTWAGMTPEERQKVLASLKGRKP
jgi:hypothetical protein